MPFNKKNTEVNIDDRSRLHAEFKELYESDMHRYDKSTRGGYIRKFHYYFRRCQTTNNFITKLWAELRFRMLKQRRGIEISYRTKIDKGLYLGHAYNIVINPSAIIGKNCNIHKGVLIGQENRGARKGAPIIGDKVWIGINASIVGNITIGDDVLIAPNSYVNCNVPSHSVVLGNPCIICSRADATEDYINRTE